MEDEDDLLHHDDSVFEGIINQSLNQSTDCLMEDSFSEVHHTSTPDVKRKGKGKAREVSPPSSRVLRSQSPLLSSPGRASSPSQSSASPRRSLRISQASPSPSHQQSPARSSSVDNSSSPSRRSVRLSSVTQPSSPQPSSNQASKSKSPCPSTSRVAQPTGSSGPKPVAPKRIKCRECPATLANERTFATHKKLHSLKRALAKVSSPDDFMENIPILLQDTMQLILKEPHVGTHANDIRDLSKCLANSLSNLNEIHDELFQFLHSNLYPLVTDCQGVFSSSLAYVFHVGVNKLLNNQDFVTRLKMHILGLEEVNQPSDSVMNIFVASLMLKLSCVTVVFITKKIHGSTANDEVPRKRSADKIDSLTFLQLCYHIGGSVVSTLLFKGEKYRVTNPAWERFVGALKQKFLASEAIGNKCADEVAEFTQAKDRGGLKHITQEALDFFVVLFDLLMSLEGSDGSLPPDVVTNNVLEDNVILCLWDILVGCELDEDSSLDFLMQVTEACAKIVSKGILLRRVNENLKKSFAAVSLRSRLSE
ncbi:High mobility group nucleosome-binding domain-containing protein 3 [Frankliniella fusca]|uniref:High mobility group nucleosome-binding domain-containing protein 3 n=1 Tax=Frankliniella fusca TaxID=407009 RepID=A0AAE1HX46_9NEOP|nr:High mobility group nucleosome-binding domain-containing protein 3 [Frankliniella fusca]